MNSMERPSTSFKIHCTLCQTKAKVAFDIERAKDNAIKEGFAIVPGKGWRCKTCKVLKRITDSTSTQAQVLSAPE